METILREGVVRDYPFRVTRRGAFVVAGYTYLVPKDAPDAIPGFWDSLADDGRLERLRACAAGGVLLGLGSWDPACRGHSHRYTVCVEETTGTDLTPIEHEAAFFRKEIGASDWLCFDLTFGRLMAEFWDDNPYTMLAELGLRFHKGDFSVGLHFEVYPLGFHAAAEQGMEFRITVVGG